MKLSGAIKLGLGFYIGYEAAKIIDILSVEVIRKIKKKKEKKVTTCWRCGKGEPRYCEKCFEDLVNKYLGLQVQKDNKLIRLKFLKNEGEQ